MDSIVDGFRLSGLHGASWLTVKRGSCCCFDKEQEGFCTFCEGYLEGNVKVSENLMLTVGKLSKYFE